MINPDDLFLDHIVRFIMDHWGKLCTGGGVLIGMVYKTGVEHQKYIRLTEQVVDIEHKCVERGEIISVMNANLLRLMGKFDVQPVEFIALKRRSDDGKE
jgi:hypothetical protein